MSSSNNRDSRALGVVYEMYRKHMILYRSLSCVLAVGLVAVTVGSLAVFSKKNAEIVDLQKRLDFKSGELLSATAEAATSFDTIKLNLPDVHVLEKGQTVAPAGAETESTASNPARVFNGLQFYFPVSFKISETDQFVKGEASNVVVYGSNMNLSNLVPEISGTAFTEITGTDRCVVSEGKTSTGQVVFTMIAMQNGKPFHLVSISADRKVAYHTLYEVSGWGSVFDKGYEYLINDVALNQYMQLGTISILGNKNSSASSNTSDGSFVVEYGEDLESTVIYGIPVRTGGLDISRVVNDNIATVRANLIASGDISGDAKMELVTNAYPTWLKLYGDFSRYVIDDGGKQKNLYLYTVFDPVEQMYLVLYTVSPDSSTTAEKILHAVVTELVFK